MHWTLHSESLVLGIKCSVTAILRFLIILTLNLCSVREVQWDKGACIPCGFASLTTFPLPGTVSCLPGAWGSLPCIAATLSLGNSWLGCMIGRRPPFCHHALPGWGPGWGHLDGWCQTHAGCLRVQPAAPDALAHLLPGTSHPQYRSWGEVAIPETRWSTVGWGRWSDGKGRLIPQSSWDSWIFTVHWTWPTI